ncbi:hypothetical protein [Streptomyces niveiscabiei]|uniref:Uncharacterized protein n=1 Tax=Streptomyces niveiscabiei TaxID=164115 RepID=A0ABW9HPL3_9ACTN
MPAHVRQRLLDDPVGRMLVSDWVMKEGRFFEELCSSSTAVSSMKR